MTKRTRFACQGTEYPIFIVESYAQGDRADLGKLFLRILNELDEAREAIRRVDDEIVGFDGPISKAEMSAWWKNLPAVQAALAGE